MSNKMHGLTRAALHQDSKAACIMNSNDQLFSTPGASKKPDMPDLLSRIDAIFKTPLFAEAVKKVSLRKTATVDDLIDVIMDNNLRNKTAEFREKFNQFDTSKINDLSPKKSCTVLWSACRSGQYEIVHLLLNVGGIKCWGHQQHSGNMSTCLHAANWGGYPEVLAQLLNKECRRSGNEELFPYEEENPNVNEEKRRKLRTLWDNYSTHYIGGISDFLPEISDDLRGNYERKNKDFKESFINAY